jgi:hypothetical protein
LREAKSIERSTMMLHKLRIALAVTVMAALAAVSVVDTASALAQRGKPYVYSVSAWENGASDLNQTLP